MRGTWRDREGPNVTGTVHVFSRISSVGSRNEGTQGNERQGKEFRGYSQPDLISIPDSPQRCSDPPSQAPPYSSVKWNDSTSCGGG